MLPTVLPGSPRTQEDVIESLRRTIGAYPAWLGGIRTSNLRLLHVATVPAAEGRPAMVYVDFIQQLVGLDVEGTSVHFSVKLLEDRTALMFAQARVYPAVRLSASARLSVQAARAKAAESLGLDPQRATLRRAGQRLRYLDGRWRRVQEARFEESAYKAVVDEVTGEGWLEEDRVYGTVQGNVKGRGVQFDPVTTGANLDPLTLSDLTVTTTGGSSTVTDATGLFDFPTEQSPTTVNASLRGRWAAVSNTAGAHLAFSGSATPGVPLAILFNPAGSAEFDTAQVNGFFHTTAIRNWVQNRLASTPLAGIDIQLPVNVNLTGSCNAFYDFASINFYRSGGNCINYAFDTIVYHEYGHFVDDQAGGLTDGGLSEGWGDILSAYPTNQPLIGENSRGPGTKIRTADNSYQYPPSGTDEVHALGQAWAGFAWHLRANLIASQGAAAGVATAESLVIPTVLANAADIPAAAYEVLLLDDDDGNLSNGTPHEAEIRAAAAQHSIPLPESDVTPPSPVGNLGAQPAGLGRVTLTWTATGDDGLTGRATSYDIRYALAPVSNGAVFDAATQAIGEPLPQISGSAEQMTVSGLTPGTTFFFAIKAVDNMGNASPLSNSPSATTAAGTVILSEAFESGAPGWTTTGLWHASQARANSPTTSRAYHDGVDYDTGAANSGNLTSPPINLTQATEALLIFAQWFETESWPEPFDIRRVEVSFDGGASWSLLKQRDSRDPNQPFWAVDQLDLAAYLGRTILIRFLFDTVDSVNNTFEGWYVDDVRVFATIPQQPDLIMTDPHPTTTAFEPGKSFFFSNTVKNPGAAVSTSFTIAFHLSKDAVYGGTDDVVFSKTRTVSGLAAGSLSTESTSLTVPSSTALGAYYVCALADSGSSISEASETNNSTCTGSTVLVTRPDLVMTALSGPSSGLTGAAISVTTTVTNQGQVSSSSFSVGIYLSSDATITTGDTRIGTRSVSTLGAGAGSTGTSSVTVPATLAPATYYLGAIADYGNSRKETSETNNALTGSTIAVTPGADLLMTAVSGPTSATRGNTVSISTTVKNQGAGSAASFSVGIYLSTDATITTSDTRIGTRSISSLGAGSSSTGSKSLTLSTSLTAGTYYLGAIADYSNARPETNETNNARTGNLLALK